MKKTFTFLLLIMWVLAVKIATAQTYTPPGNALYFNGNSSFAQINSAGTAATNFSNSSFTIEAWIRPTSLNNNIMNIFGHKEGGFSNPGYALSVNSYLTKDGLVNFEGSASTSLASSESVLLDVWSHIAFTYNYSGTGTTGTGTIYINGRQVATGPISIIGTSQPARLGAYSTGNYWFNGGMDEIRVWNYARTQTQIRSTLLNEIAPATTGLVLYYKFDQGVAGGSNPTVTTVTDLTGNHYDATLNSVALTGTTTSNWLESYAMAVPTATAATNVGVTSLTANWTAPVIGTVENYYLEVSSQANFSTYVTGYNKLSVPSSATSYNITGLTPGTTYYYRVRANRSSVANQGGAFNQISATTDKPVISVTGTLGAFNTTTGSPSAASSISIAATNLTVPVTVTSPSGFEVSTDGVNYSNTVSLGSSSTLGPSTVYVRLRSSATAATYSGNLVLSSTGATSVNVTIPTSTVSVATVISGHATNTAAAGASVIVDNTLTITTGITSLTGANVLIGSNLQTGDLLNYTGTLPVGVTSNYNSATGILQFTGTATAADYQALLRTVTFTSAANTASLAGRPITFSLGSALAYAGNNHFYEYVGTSLSWVNAKAAAAGRTLFGLQGYLATVTSSGENSFVNSKLLASAWLGGTDAYTEINAATGTNTYADQAAAESNFYWVTGPEKGQQFSTVAKHPVAVNNMFNFWDPNTQQPDNLNGNENYLGIFGHANIYINNSAYSWNDFLGTAETDLGYIVEYGGMPGDPANVLTYTNTLSLTSPPTINVSGTAVALSGTSGTASAPNYVTVSGTDMTSGILVSAPAGFEVSTDGINFSRTLTTGATGTIAATKVYYRLAAANAADSYSGNIVLSSTGATSVNVAIPVSTMVPANPAAPTVSVTGTFTYTGTAGGGGSLTGATSGDAVLDWYDQANGGTKLGSGSPFMPNVTNAGTYTFYAGSRDPNTGLVSTTRIPVTFTILPVPLTVTAATINKTYGTALTNGNSASGFTATGLKGTDAIGTVTLTYGTGAAANATANTYTGSITPSAATGSAFVATNYTITYATGNIVVNKAALIITADNKTKIYGAANPALTATYTGFVNNETSASLTSAPTISTSTTATSTVGTYVINVAGAASANYTIIYINGNLAVTKAALTITADNKNKVYGAANPALTVTYSGFVNGDTQASLTTSATASTTATTASPIGNYAITAAGAGSDNYNVTYVAGNLAVTNATLTVTADNKTKVYGTTNPALTLTYSGFVNGDTQAMLTTPATVSTSATTASGAGTYAITATGVVSPNYNITYVQGTLTITKAILTITSDNKSRNYGVSNPALTASYSGFINGDTQASLTTLATATTIATSTSAPGNYPILASGAISANYTFNYVNGTLTVIPLTVASLNGITISPAILSPAFSAGTGGYTTKVDNGTGALTIVPAFDPTATATINGQPAGNGSIFYYPLNIGNNTITIVVTAQDGMTKQTYTINVYRGVSPLSLAATNILTPNGDGKNDLWKIQDIDLYPNNTVTVFDKAARPIFSQKGYNNTWDGTVNGSPLTQGTYYYIVNLGPGLPQFKGFITVLRSN